MNVMRETVDMGFSPDDPPRSSTEATLADTTALLVGLPQSARDAFGPHPFQGPLGRDLLQSLLPEYLAMSQAFPYLQAASQRDGIFEAMALNQDLPEDFELTSAVGNFLCWDETGGHHAVLGKGNAGLPEILETGRNFHSNLLRRDAARILGRPVRPNYSPVTRRYLQALYRGLASPDAVRRCAQMFAFETHAAEMIQALWGSVAEATGLAREELTYFQVHAGGDYPAEAYHGEMTRRMVDRVVPPRERARFVDEYLTAYGLNVAWCRGLVEAPRATLAATGSESVWHSGSCHCGGVRFRVRAPAALTVVRCSCSICEMTGFLHLAARAEDMRILSGTELLDSYRFNTRIAEHLFCRHCGVKPFYRPRSDPDGYSVNLRCLDRALVESVEIAEFDGRRWEYAMADTGLPAGKAGARSL
jgi:hypothetical protein